MKEIVKYILEKLVVSKASKQTSYSCQPNTKVELKKILEERLKKDKSCDLNDIDVSLIEDMSYLFCYLDPHNIDISQWDVSRVTKMTNMFYRCHNFNCDLSQWDMSSVEYTNYMFYNCKNFNCDLSQWDVSNVRCSSYMFYGCESLNCDLSGWDMPRARGYKNKVGMFGLCNSLENNPAWYIK